MAERRISDLGDTLERIRSLALAGQLRISVHAHQEMVDEDITTDQLFEAIASGEILENYPQHRRGPCCLLCGHTVAGRPLHVVCTTALELLIVITAYEPKTPKWSTPARRRETR